MNEGECIPLRILFQKQWGDHRQVRAHPNTRARAFASDFTFRPSGGCDGWLAGLAGPGGSLYASRKESGFVSNGGKGRGVNLAKEV